MASINKVILIGNLGRDPEVRFMPNGNAVCDFSVATSEKFKGRDGNLQERTEWHNVTVFGKQAEAAGKYLSKGSPVYIEGQIRTEEYEAKDGSGKRKAVKIIAQRVQFLSGGKGSERKSAPAASGGGGDDSFNAPPMDDEDIPFIITSDVNEGRRFKL